MRIAMLSVHSSPLGRAGSKDTGGMSTYVRGLAEALGQMGHRVDIFTCAADSNNDEIQEIAANVRLVSIATGLATLEKNELYPHIAAIAGSIDNLCRTNKFSYSLIFSHYWLSGCAGRILKQRWKVPHLIMFHTLGQTKNEACAGENEPLLRLEEEEMLACESERVIVAAQQEKERIISYYDLLPEKVVVIPPGIDRDLFYIRDKAKIKAQLGFGEEKVILFVGRIEPVKGLDLLVQAAALLPADFDFRLIVIGGDDRSRVIINQLNENAAKLGIAGKVIFRGLIAHQDLPLYYSAADITVMPSSYESCGLVALESLACGTPVVAGPVGIIPELVSTSVVNTPVYMVNDRNPAAWAAAIKKALALSHAHAHSNPIPISQAAVEKTLAPFNWTQSAGHFINECQKL